MTKTLQSKIQCGLLQVVFLHLKYILLPGINDSVEDMDSFVKIAKELKVNSVYLSQDLHNFSKTEDRKGNENMSETKFASYSYIISKIKEANLAFNVSGNWFTSEDYERINKLCSE